MWKVLVICALWRWSECLAQDDSWQTSLDNISRNLHWDMSYLRDTEPVNYSEPVINTTYKASSEFDMRAMGPLYNSTKLIIDTIANKQAYPEGFVSVSDGHLEVWSAREHWRELAAHYAGPVAVLVVAALLALSLPLAGLLWCCCQCCGSRRRRRPFDRKYDACLKGCLAILLIALITLFLFGVVCTFATETQWEEGAGAAPVALRTGASDVAEFLNASQAHARWLLVNNFHELEANLNSILDKSGVLVGARLSELSRAASVSTLHGVVRQLGPVRRDLVTLADLINRLRAYAEDLRGKLQKVRTLLLHTLSDCSQPECRQLDEKYRVGRLEANIDYNQLPDLTGLVRNVSALAAGNISAEVAAGDDALTGLQQDISAAVNRDVPQVRAAIAHVGEELLSLADEITNLAGNMSAAVRRQAASADTLESAHRTYGPYRRYVGLGTAVALLVITFMLCWGVTCGVCGKRPDAYGASDCCNKGAGASCLLCGMVLTFVVGGAVALVLAGYFAAGVATQRFLCDPLQEPRGNRLFEDLDQFVDFEKTMFNEHRDPDYNLSAVLIRCHQNETIYETLHLHRLYDLDALELRLSSEVAARVALRPRVRPDVTILRPQAREQLQRLADTGLSEVNFDRILEIVEPNITAFPLEALVARLANASAALEARPGYARVAADLAEAGNKLQHAHDTVVVPMMNITETLATLSVSVRDTLRFNSSSLREAVAKLVRDAAAAEQVLNVHGPRLIQNMTQQIVEELEVRVRAYLKRVRAAARGTVGRCEPVSRAVNATRDAACRNVLMPTNGYWIALSWCLVLFVPVLVVAQRLARLYRHVDPYPGPLVEAEYLYDAYADRDNVPLANAYKAEKRAARARGGASGGGGGGVASSGGVAAPGPAAPPADARRYNDMAPKHWEEGPPRYHGPTEYERPPPYYYPGPNDRQ